MADSGEINEIILQLHIKLRPSHHSCQTSVDGSNSRTFLRRPHFFKSRVGSQRLAGFADIYHLLYQLFLTTEHQKVFRQIAGEKITVRHRIDNDIFTLIIECFRRIARRNVFLHKTVDQRTVSIPQPAVKHLITIIVRLMKTDQHLIHLPAQTVRSIFEKRIKILFQIRKEFGNIKILVIPTTGQLIHFHYKFGYIFRRKHC